jgi:hypothetical protein
MVILLYFCILVLMTCTGQVCLGRCSRTKTLMYLTTQWTLYAPVDTPFTKIETRCDCGLGYPAHMYYQTTNLVAKTFPVIGAKWALK